MPYLMAGPFSEDTSSPQPASTRVTSVRQHSPSAVRTHCRRPRPVHRSHATRHTKRIAHHDIDAECAPETTRCNNHRNTSATSARCLEPRDHAHAMQCMTPWHACRMQNASDNLMSCQTSCSIPDAWSETTQYRGAATPHQTAPCKPTGTKRNMPRPWSPVSQVQAGAVAYVPGSLSLAAYSRQ